MKLNGISRSFFINLHRRKDRLDHIYKNTPFFCERFEALDAKNLILNQNVKNLFPDTYYKLTKSEIACTLSHYNLWKKLISDKGAKNYLILEDDVVFNQGFVEHWNEKWSKNIPDFHLAYVGGCQPWNKPRYHEVLKPESEYFNSIKRNNHFTDGDHYWHMNASSYIVTKEAASLMCQYVEQNGFDCAFDVFIIKLFSCNKLFSTPQKVLHLNPLMARQLHEEKENTGVDKNSDLRFSKDRFKKEECIKYKLIWQVDPNDEQQTYERDWILELFQDIDFEEIIDGNYSILEDNSIIIYTDIWEGSKTDDRQNKLYSYLDQASKKQNVSIVHLGDEYTQARTSHYKNFKLAIRTTYNDSVKDVPNLIQIPLGYKQGFHD